MQELFKKIMFGPRYNSPLWPLLFCGPQWQDLTELGSKESQFYSLPFRQAAASM